MAMRADLIERYIVNNPGTAEILKGTGQTAPFTTQAQEIRIKAADPPAAIAHHGGTSSQWFGAVVIPRHVEAEQKRREREIRR